MKNLVCEDFVQYDAICCVTCHIEDDSGLCCSMKAFVRAHPRILWGVSEYQKLWG